MLISAESVSIAMARPAFSDGQKAAVEDIIQGLEDDLQAYLKRPLVPEDVTDEIVLVTDSGKVYLKKTPVLAVTSFMVGTIAQPVDSFTVRTWGFENIFSPFLPSSLLVTDPLLTVSYRGGLPGDDPESEFGKTVRSKLKRAATRAANQVVLERAAGVRRLSVEGTSIEFEGEGWLDAELVVFARWKRRMART